MIYQVRSIVKMTSLELILPARNLALYPDYSLSPLSQREPGSGSSGITKAGTIVTGRNRKTKTS